MTTNIWIIAILLTVSMLIYLRVTMYWLAAYRRTFRRIVLGMTVMGGLIALLIALRILQLYDAVHDRLLHDYIGITVAVILLATSVIQCGITRGWFNKHEPTNKGV